MNLATGSATPPSTAMAIMPTRSFPPGAISDAGAVCPNATADKPASNAIERRIRPICLSPERIVDRNPTSPHDDEANYALILCVIALGRRRERCIDAYLLPGR